MSPDIALSCSIIPSQLLFLTHSQGWPGFNHLSPADQPKIDRIVVLRVETTSDNQQSLKMGISIEGFHFPSRSPASVFNGYVDDKLIELWNARNVIDSYPRSLIQLQGFFGRINARPCIVGSGFQLAYSPRNPSIDFLGAVREIIPSVNLVARSGSHV